MSPDRSYRPADADWQARPFHEKNPLSLTSRTRHIVLTGNSAFSASMSANLIDFPPSRRRPRLFLECHAPAGEPHSLCAAASTRPAGRPGSLAASLHRDIDRSSVSAMDSPTPRSSAISVRGRPLLSTRRTASRFELRRKPDSSPHRTPPVSVGALHFCEARPGRDDTELRQMGVDRR